jgi:hypothetical protein
MEIGQVRRFALSLPETLEAPHFRATSFRVGGRIFATVPPGDEVLHIFLDEEQREAALAMHPAFLEKLFWGKKACGLRTLLAKAKPKVVEGLLSQAWKDKAPKALLGTADTSLHSRSK